MKTKSTRIQQISDKIRIFVLFGIIAILSSCEGGRSGGGASSGASRSKESTVVTDITSDYFGTYVSDCIADGSMVFGTTKVYTVEASSLGATVTVEEFANSNCTTSMAIRSYEVDFSVDLSVDEQSLEETTTLHLEYLQSTLEITHSANDGYWDCGVTMTTNVEYILNSDCIPNQDGDEMQYKVTEINATRFKLNEQVSGSEVIFLTKQ